MPPPPSPPVGDQRGSSTTHLAWSGAWVCLAAAVILGGFATLAWPFLVHTLLPFFVSETSWLWSLSVDTPLALGAANASRRLLLFTAAAWSSLVVARELAFGLVRLAAARSGRYRRHFPYLLQARWPLLAGMVCGLIYSASTALGIPMALKYLIPIFFRNEQEINPKVVEFAQKFLGEPYADRLLIAACIGFPLVFALRGVAAFANRYLINKAGFIVLERLRSDAYSKLLHLPLAFHGANKAGDINLRLMSDTEKLKTVMIKISEIATQPFTLMFGLIALIIFCLQDRSVFFALIAVASVPFCVIPIRLATRKLVKRSRQLAAESGALAAASIEVLQSPLEVQAYNLQADQQTRFEKRVRDIFRLSLKTVKYQAMTTPIIELVSICGFVAAIYFGTKSGMSQETFVGLAGALYFCYEPVKKLTATHAILKNGEASLERLEYVLDAQDSVPNPPPPPPIPTQPPLKTIDPVGLPEAQREGQIVEPPPALVEVNLSFAPGEVVALVGKTGAGKSTFISLLPRFYDPAAGRILLGEVDLRELDKHALRDRIAIVAQQPAVFNTTLAENIRFGRPGATDAEIEQAARRACIHDFIVSLPDGYATLVGERGGTLSGGQRQRIAIARAFLKDAPVLILDEATSALDSESESLIQQALGELIRGRTTFMIAHRFSSIRHATRILVFEHGRVVADGPHEQLLDGSSVYRELYQHQMLDAPSAPTP